MTYIIPKASNMFFPCYDKHWGEVNVLKLLSVCFIVHFHFSMASEL